MQKGLLYLGWITTVVALAAVAVLYQKLDALKVEHQSLAAEMLELSQSREVEMASSTELGVPLPEVAPPQPNAAVSLPENFNMDRVVGDMIQDMSVEPETNNAEAKEGKRGSDPQDQEEHTERREALKQRFMDSPFKGLLKALNPSPERRAELQAILQAHGDRAFDIRHMEREGLISQEEARNRLAALDFQMQSQLEATLTAQEMDQYEEYEATEPERRMTHTLNEQIKDHSNMAPGLRNKLVATFQNQLLIDGVDPENGIPLDPFTRSNVAYSQALDQLSGELTPQEYAQAQAFMEERLRMQSALVEHISEWDVNRYPGGGPWGHWRQNGNEHSNQSRGGKSEP